MEFLETVRVDDDTIADVYRVEGGDEAMSVLTHWSAEREALDKELGLMLEACLRPW